MTQGKPRCSGTVPGPVGYSSSPGRGSVQERVAANLCLLAARAGLTPVFWRAEKKSWGTKSKPTAFFSRSESNCIHTKLASRLTCLTSVPAGNYPRLQWIGWQQLGNMERKMLPTRRHRSPAVEAALLLGIRGEKHSQEDRLPGNLRCSGRVAGAKTSRGLAAQNSASGEKLFSASDLATP